METFHSDEANTVALEKDWDAVCEEADGVCEGTGETDTINVFKAGFDLAVKAVQMGALEKYAGKSLGVWLVTGQGYGSCAMFLASEEDEVLARLTPLPE